MALTITNIMIIALANKLVDIASLKENENISKKDLVTLFTETLRPEIDEMRKVVRAHAINDCRDSIKNLK